MDSMVNLQQLKSVEAVHPASVVVTLKDLIYQLQPRWFSYLCKSINVSNADDFDINLVSAFGVVRESLICV